MANAWRDFSAGDNPPRIINIVIENPKGSRIKYEINKKTGKLRIDRQLPKHLAWPVNYGFIPRTYDSDNDPMDAILLGRKRRRGRIVKAKPIALLRYIDRSRRDDKVICVGFRTKKMKLKASTAKKIKYFLNNYKKYFRQKPRVVGIYGKRAAEKEIKYCMRLYNKIYKGNP